MKQIITLFVLFLAFTTSSYAVNSVAAVTQDGTTNLTIESSKTSVFAKAGLFMKNTVNKIKKVAKAVEEDQLILILLAIFISPVAVYMYEGNQWTNRVTLNLILYIVGFGILGMAHALYLILGEK